MMPSVYETYTSDSNSYGVAVYYMAFSTCDNYMILYYQLVDNYLVRVNTDEKSGNFWVFLCF